MTVHLDMASQFFLRSTHGSDHTQLIGTLRLSRSARPSSLASEVLRKAVCSLIRSVIFRQEIRQVSSGFHRTELIQRSGGDNNHRDYNPISVALFSRVMPPFTVGPSPAGSGQSSVIRSATEAKKNERGPVAKRDEGPGAT